MPLSDNQLYFFIRYAVAFVVFGWMARWYLWPALRDRPPGTSLTPLLLYASFRVNGLMFLMPRLVSPQLPQAFAIPTAYGDLTAALLARLTLWPPRAERSAAIPVVWLFNIVGLLDLIYANISTFKDLCRSDIAWCVVLPSRHQCASHGSRTFPDLCLLADASCYMVQKFARGEVK